MLDLKNGFIQKALNNAIKVSITSRIKLYDILRNGIGIYEDDTVVELELVGREDNHIVKFNTTNVLTSSSFGSFEEGLTFIAKDSSDVTRRVMNILRSNEYLAEMTIESIDVDLYKADIVLLDTLDGYGNKFKISITKNGGSR